MASKRNRAFKGNWGNKILKKLRKAASIKSCIKNKYIGCGPVMTRIAANGNITKTGEAEVLKRGNI